MEWRRWVLVLSVVALVLVPAAMRADVAGKPVYMALSMNEGSVVRMKPQNLLLNLPLAARA